jgi:hypothetical protein
VPLGETVQEKRHYRITQGKNPYAMLIGIQRAFRETVMADHVSAWTRLKIGFFYGVGFSFGCACVLVLVYYGTFFWVSSMVNKAGETVVFSSPMGEGEERVFSTKAKEQRSNFSFSNTNSIHGRSGSITVLGTVENLSDRQGRYINVYADLFDKEGAFIYQCMTQLSGGIPPGEKRNFMIECWGMPEDLKSRFESFKVSAGFME